MEFGIERDILFDLRFEEIGGVPNSQEDLWVAKESHKVNLGREGKDEDSKAMLILPEFWGSGKG